MNIIMVGINSIILININDIFIIFESLSNILSNKNVNTVRPAIASNTITLTIEPILCVLGMHHNVITNIVVEVHSWVSS